MKQIILLIAFATLLFTGQNVFAQSQTENYTTADIPMGGNGVADACTASIPFSIPPGSTVDSIRTWYTVEAVGGGYRSDAMTRIQCLEGATEAAYTPGTLTGTGSEFYNRSISSLFSGVTATGILNFNISAYDSYNAAMVCGAPTDVFIADDSWTITVYYTAPPAPFVYIGSSATQSNTSNVAYCSNNQQIIGLEVEVTGNIGTFNLTDIELNMNGTTLTTDATAINVYYTGLSSTFATTTLFGTTGSGPGSLNVSGVQGLTEGTNYFWVTYDMAGPIYIGGNNMDAECTQITIDAVNYIPGITDPGVGRTTDPCQTFPGSVSGGHALWFKANEIGLADNSLTSAWSDSSPNGFDAAQSNVAKQPYFRDNTGYNLNFNPVVDFIRDNGTPANSDRLDFTTPTNSTQNVFLAFATTQSNNQCSWHYDYSMIYGGDVNPFVVPGESDFVIGLGDWFGSGTNLALGGGSDADWTRETSSLLSTGLPVLLTFDKVNTNVSQLDMAWRMNGIQDGTYSVDSLDCGAPMPSMAALGSSPTTPSSGFDGSIAEVIVYDHILNPVERNKVESYLAIKYGVTLDQSTPQNYVLSDGTISWNSAIVPVTYNYDIAGISRDDVSSQYQKQSKSVNPGSLVTIGLGAITTTNSTNAGSFGSDQHTLTWSNNRDANAWGVAEVPPSISQKLVREWFTEENVGDVGVVTVEVNDADLPPVGGNIVHLLIDADGDFSSGATVLPMTLTGGVWSRTVNLTDEYYFSFGINATPLPIELLEFNATAANDKVLLDWSTATELDNDYFTVERSIDGLEWEPVLRKDGAGTSHEALFYSDMDNSPLSGVSYYRLKQTDFNGSSSYSEIRMVQFEKASFNVYPNPTRSLLIIEGDFSDLNDLLIIDMLGKVVNDKVSLMTGDSSRIKLNTSQLSEGVYSIRIGEEVHRIIIK